MSGAIDEDTAVATMSAGAVDYVLKDNLTRLAPAVRSAIGGADLRRAHRQAAEAARLALFAVDNASLAVTMVARDGTVVYVNDYACKTFAGERGDLVGKMIWDLDQGMPRETWQEILGPGGRRRARSSSAWTGGQPDGSRLVLDVTVNYLEAADVLVSYGRDITRRVVAEEALRRRADQPGGDLRGVSGRHARLRRGRERGAREQGGAAPGGQGRAAAAGAPAGQRGAVRRRARVRAPPRGEDGCGTSPECPLCPLRNAVAAVLEATVSMRGVEFSMDVLRDGEPEQRLAAHRRRADGHGRRAARHRRRGRHHRPPPRGAGRCAESEERFEQFAEHVPGYVYMNDAERRCVYVNQLGAVDGRR